MEISKELLSEVLVRLELDYEYPIEFYSNKNAFRYWVMESPKYQSTSEYINIYELAFKLKIWAYSNCCELVSYTEGCEIFQTQLDETIKYFYAETEVEAIFLACEYILNNIKH